MKNCSHDLFIFFFISTKSKKSKGHPLLSRASRTLFWSCPSTRESLKKPYFPLLLSILAGTNLIMLLFFFLQPPFDSQENPSPIWFPGKIHPRLISEKIHSKPPKKTKKIAFLLLPVFSGFVLRVTLLLCHWI